MNYLKYLIVPILSIFFTTNAFAVVYEDAEDGTTTGWRISDNDPSGAIISNIFDSQRESNVIHLQGAKTKNAYELGAKSGSAAWSNKTSKLFSWKMKTEDKYKIYIYLKTTKGSRYLYYTYHNSDKGHYKTKYIHHGLGKNTRDGTWHTFSRDLESDLHQYESDNSIISVNGFRIKGSASLDDMELSGGEEVEEDVTPPVITLHGSAEMTLPLNEPYVELGATANDDKDGSIDVSISGSVDGTIAGEYIITYSAVDTHNNSATVTRTVTVQAPIVQGEGKLILNEYNAVKSSKKLKNSGTDSYFGRVVGNGGSWIELVSTAKHIDIRGARLTITQSGSDDFHAKLPYETQLGHLRRGTIITISEEPTDMSYAPFAPNGDDWTLNINVNDLLEKVGTFKTSSKSLSVSLKDTNGAYILFPSGEEHTATSIGNNEVFKLKKNPAYAIQPSDGSYGDDGSGKSYSTFGTPNRWGVNGEYRQDFNGLRANQDLTEVGGLVVSTMPALSSVTDAESLLYLPQNDTLWIADDDTHVALEMKFSTQTLLSTYNDVQLGTFAATIDDACDRGAKRGACDIESVAYNSDSDELFIYVGKSASQSAIFRLNRPNINSSFNLVDYINLEGHEYSAVQYAEGEMVVAIDKNVYIYDYSTNSKSARIFRSPDGKIFGMAYHNGTMWLTTSKFKLIRVDWATKNVEAIYDMTKNGVYDPRGIEIINNKLYILEGMNAIGSNQVLAPLGHALKNSIHIYNIPE